MESFNAQAYWERRLTAHGGLEGVGCVGFGENYNRWLYRVREKVFARILHSLPLDVSTATAVDIGSGSGFYIEQWRKFGVKEVTGIDITETAVLRLRQHFAGSEFYVADISDAQLPLPKQPYDVASAFDVLFHIVDDKKFRRALENICSLLRPGGFFLYSDNFVHRRDKGAVVHHVNRSLEEVRAALQETGFSIVERRPMFILMNIPVDTRHDFLKKLWYAAMWPVRKSENVGNVVGSLLYPLELWLTKCLRESPTTEIVICRKQI